MERVYVSTPLYYVNSKPHIGHSYTQVICDAIARFHRQRGREVFFLTGTDEHGEKIEQTALKAGFKAGEEKQFVDGIVAHFQALWVKLGIEYDRFIRTTDPIHIATVHKVLSALYAEGKIYKESYCGWYCTPCETFWSESQAAACACPDCKRPVEKLDEENYFFRLSAYQEQLLEHIRKTPGFIEPDIRRNEVISFLEKNRLQDLCISRPKKRLRWGIELPFDREYVVYVWFDALLNYISGTGYIDDRARFERFWPSAWHVIGKDIIRQHAVYWPIMLMALGEQPPKRVSAHGWWVVDGEKMSKSKGNVVDPMAMVDAYGVEAFRYYLLSAVQFGYDGVFSEKLFIEKYNTDLANDLGNLVNRTLTMVEKYYAGTVPAVPSTAIDPELVSDTGKLPAAIDALFAGGDASLVLKAIWEIVDRANKYIEHKAPWKLAKEPDKTPLALVMYNLVQALGIVALLIYPFMPQTSRSIWKQLGMSGDPAKTSPLIIAEESREVIPQGTVIAKASPLFPRIEIK